MLNSAQQLQMPTLMPGTWIQVGNQSVRSFLLSLVLLTPSVAAAQNGDMGFRLTGPAGCDRNCPAYVLGEGYITSDTVRRYQDFVARHGANLPVFLNSRGGELQGGIRLGAALRAQRAAVYVPSGGTCASACAYAFLGGVVRGVQEGGRIGVHRPIVVRRSSGRRSAADEQALEPRIAAILTNYVAAMGGSPALVALAAGTEPPAIRYLSPAELRRYKVVKESES